MDNIITFVLDRELHRSDMKCHRKFIEYSGMNYERARLEAERVIGFLWMGGGERAERLDELKIVMLEAKGKENVTT